MILPIFPEGGLASSVITTVWVGVFVLCFFNLRFGWVLSGLVVPGYIVPLLVVKPVAALVIVVEAVITYLIIYIFSEKLAPGRWPALFGRDRFMGLILASIAVRLSMDGFILPQVADWLASNFNQQLDWQSDLQSFGLVIISLMANQFWKPGLLRGFFSMVVVTAITWFIIRYGLMEFTNFRLSGVTYMYEGLASSILASPKAYMILVLTALYASHMNVKYGWDFSGILIPALIALQWYQPTKIVSSFAEAILIYFIARQLIKSRWLANVTIEGGTKILLFFNVSFVLKLLVGHLLVWLAWDVKTTDFYGFGYLLSTLLAIKAYDKDIFPRLMRSTLQVSAIGAVLGNLAGLLLAAILPATAAQASDDPGRTPGQREDGLLVRAVGDARFRSATSSDGTLANSTFAGLADAVEMLDAGLPPLRAGANGTSEGWRIVGLGDARTALVRADGRGEDLLVFDANAPNDLAVILGDPGEAPGLALAGAQLAKHIGARWLVITAPQPAGRSGSGTVEAAFRSARTGPVLQASAPANLPLTRLELGGNSATAIDLERLRQAMPGLEIGFAQSRTGKGAGQGGAATLLFASATIDRLLHDEPHPQQPVVQCRELGPTPGSQLPERVSQLLFLREEVVRPLLGRDASDASLAVPIRSASALGLDLAPCQDGTGKLLALNGPFGAGTYFFDPAGNPRRIVLSSARSEISGTEGERTLAADALHDAGFAVRRTSAAMLLAIAPRELGYDGDQSTIFGVVLQATLDTMGDSDALVLQLRSYPEDPAPVARGRAVITTDRLGTHGARTTELEAIVRAAGLDPVLAQRTREWAGFEAYPQTALLYLNHSLAKRFAVIYVAPQTKVAR